MWSSGSSGSCESGVHATLAGVLIALKDRAPGLRPLKRVEHGLRPWVAFAVLPVFAFANRVWP